MSMILIVEDDVFIHEYMEIIIQEIGHETLSARDMDGALSHFHAPQQIDLLVTDIYLKKACSGGIELAQQAIKIRPKLPVLYTTGNAVTDELKALFVEDARYLRKPYTLRQLRNFDWRAAHDEISRSRNLNHVGQIQAAEANHD